MSEQKTYEATLASHDPRVWPGCKGEGRCRPCGQIHNFPRRIYDRSGNPSYEPDYCCLRNYEDGCPNPIPEPEHDWQRRRCVKCRVRQPVQEVARGT